MMKSKHPPELDVFTPSINPLVQAGVRLFCLFLLLFAITGHAASVTLTLSKSWKFMEDPNDIGLSSGWHTSDFPDDAWVTKFSGSTAESQGSSFATKAHYIWYRQKIEIPSTSAGTPLLLSLANFPDNGDDVWFNGQRIGGSKGYQMYKNITDRKYSISSGINYGGINTIAVRLWATNSVNGGPGKNGLTAGTYKIELNPYHIMARNVGGTIASEKPIMGLGVDGQAYDMSAGQKAQPFEMVLRFPVSDLGGSSGSANASFWIYDFTSTTNLLHSGTVPLNLGSDSIVRGVISISGTTARKLYFAGRLTVKHLLKDAVSGVALSGTTVIPLDRLSYYARDKMSLPALSPVTYESTPYGNLKLVDTIDCSTALNSEVHPYLQGEISGDQNRVYYRTPGLPANVALTTIGGKIAREPKWSFFSYRIGRGTLTPGKSYMLRVEYPEDKPRYCVLGVQAGDNYYDVGWKNGVSSTDPYDPWPLNSTPTVWKNYDMIFTLGNKSLGTGGGGDADPSNGVWVYCANSNASGGGPGYQYLYQGGIAVATIKLYEIDPLANAPVITLPPAGIPQRTLMFDWEHEAEMKPIDVVNHAKLMGYSALSPITGIKWNFSNYGGVCNGFKSYSIDKEGYKVVNPAFNPAGPALAGTLSIHEQFLEATRNSGINYIPRFEYGGSLLLSQSAYAINNVGVPAMPNRFTGTCNNLLTEEVYQDMKKYLDSFIAPYAAANPQMTGALWRIRGSRLPVSYGPSDITMFCADTGTQKPAGYTSVQLARWASNTAPEGDATVASNYSSWWQKKRRDFHVRIKDLLKSYRSDLTLYYYNWDQDNFSMMGPDINAWDFTEKWHQKSAATKLAVWNGDRTARASYTSAEYINVISTGSFAASGTNSWPQIVRPDYAMRPSLYRIPAAAGIQILAPMPQYYCYANRPDYMNYFSTYEGLAVSTCITYDEQHGRSVCNPRHEENSVLPGGAPFSMSLELLAYFHGDARTLTKTSYTYGRGFADAHRRFAQAFRALPALPATVVTAPNTDTKVRTYASSNGTYVGVAYRGMTGTSLTITIPNQAGKTVKNLVTGATVAATDSGTNRVFTLATGPMELNAFLVSP